MNGKPKVIDRRVDMNFRTAYGDHEPVRTVVVGKSRTKQSFKAECDINNIMAKYQKSGAVAHVNRHGAEYGYATSLDFAEAMRVVTTGQSMFDDLPSSVRTRFSNDPASFLSFVQDDSNEDEMRELGLLPKEPVEVAPPAPPVAPGEVDLEPPQ